MVVRCVEEMGEIEEEMWMCEWGSGEVEDRVLEFISRFE